MSAIIQYGAKIMTYSQMADLAARVAASAGASTTETQSRAISLHMSKALAMVALLGLGGPWQWTSVGLVAYYIVLDRHLSHLRGFSCNLPGCLPKTQLAIATILW